MDDVVVAKQFLALRTSGLQILTLDLHLPYWNVADNISLCEQEFWKMQHGACSRKSRT